MKRRIALALTGALSYACLWGALPSEAAPKQQAEKKVRWKDMPSMPSKEYKRFDKNGDGALDAAEKQAVRDTFKRTPTDSYLVPYDRDDDKNLTDKEIAGIPPKEIDLKALEKMKTANKSKQAPKKK